ncbi:MAG: sigma factor [Planctomycetota bacterium]
MHPNQDSHSAVPPRTNLDDISTRWSVVGDPLQFVMRYGEAIKAYLLALLDDPNDADDVCQDLLANALVQGFRHASPDQGRFRKYLKVAVRHAAWEFFRKRKSLNRLQAGLAEHLTGTVQESDPADSHWQSAWRACVLERAWKRLHNHQRRSGDSLFYTVLRAATDHSDATGVQQAAYVAQITGQPMRPDTYRKQLSRARQLFAEFLVDEVAQTLADRHDLNEELADLGLLEYVRVRIDSHTS